MAQALNRLAKTSAFSEIDDASQWQCEVRKDRPLPGTRGMRCAVLIDSNLTIYATQQKHAQLRKFIEADVPQVSVVSKDETLGYHGLEEKEKTFLEDFPEAAVFLPVSQKVVQEAIRLRQQKSMSLSNSLIGATAVKHELMLMAHNTDDFD